MTRIVKVSPREDYCVDVLLDNGSSITLNMENRLNTLRFGMLEDKTFFKSVTTDGSYIRWDSMIEISVSEVFQLAQK